MGRESEPVLIGDDGGESQDAARLAAVLGGSGERLFLSDRGETWTVGRLRSLAAEVARAIPEGAPAAVAVRTESPGFLLAAQVGLWRSGRHALLVDPTLVHERSVETALAETLVLVPSTEDPAGGRVVRETGGPPIDVRLPSRGEVEVEFFTSGSTGEPKRVTKRAYQFRRQARVEAPFLGLGRGLSVLSLVPAHHILGYMYGLEMPGMHGGTSAFLRGAPQTWVAAIRALQPSLVVGVPSHYRLMTPCVDGPLPAAVYLSSGAPLPPEVGSAFARAAGSEIVQVFGSTETGGVAIRRGDGPWQPLPGLEWSADPETGRLSLRSPWSESPGEWRLGDDLVEREGDGFRLAGRADSIVKVGGRRFSTIEIVRAAEAHPDVEQAHAVSYERYGENAVALFVVPRADTALEWPAVRAFLAERLAPFKVPRTVRVVPSLPVKGIGKVDAERLREMARSGGDA